MEIFNKLFHLMNTNKWFTTIGLQINELITRNGHLISEDITFIESIISSQNDLQLNDCENSINLKSIYYNNRLKIVMICSLTIGMIWYSCHDISYQSLISTIIYSSLLTSLPITYDLIRKIYLRNRLLNKAIDLSDKVINERDLLNKYFKLIEDNEVIDKSERQSSRVREMKQSFRTICWKCFSRIRESTIHLRLKFPLKIEIDDEMNFLCCLPMESFDKFLAEDQSVITMNLLKSLMRLNRLQQSEFFRRIICLFMTICSQNKCNRSHDSILNIYNEVLKIFDVLIKETNETFTELYSSYSCGKSLWICSEKSVSNNSYSETHQRSETFSFMNINRSIRKHLLTALSIVDDCDAIIQDGIQIGKNDLIVRQKLDSINDEFKNLNDLILNLEKLLKVKELKESKTQSSSSLNVNTEESVRPVITAPNNDNYIVTDQVFEAYVANECDDNQLLCDTEDDELWEYRLQLAQEAEVSSNLFRELKVALKPKAVEHKLREAKALGIEIEELTEEQNNDSVEENEDLCNRKILCETLNNEHVIRNDKYVALHSEHTVINETKCDDNKDSVMSNTSNTFNFTTQIANIAAQRGRMFGLIAESECFGDDIEECDDQYSD